MPILWNPGGHTMTIRRNMTTGYIKASNSTKNSQIDQQDKIREVSKMCQDKLPPMPEKSAFTFHHNFYQKFKIALKDAKILEVNMT